METQMLNSPVLEVAIGLIFSFASVALMASTMKEAISSFFDLRARTLFNGIKSILNDPNLSGLALDIYNHALVNPRGNGSIAANTSFLKLRNTLPAYVASTHFAAALLESLKNRAAPNQNLIDGIQDPQIKNLIAGMVARAEGDADKLQLQLASWFDSCMDRLSGVYKRWAQLICFICGLAVAVTLNVDAIHMAQALWSEPSRTAAVVTTSVSEVERLDELRKLPLGPAFKGQSGTDKAWDCLGVLITASAAMFGAPFWFDMLQRLVQLRSTGPKPKKVKS
jgi:hypothetical protein